MESNINNDQFVTYLLGAGASANALPIVKEIPKRLESFKDTILRLSSAYTKIKTSSDLQKKELNPIIEGIEWIIEGIGNHQSVDTFAKKLFHTKKTFELLKLKTILSFFFIIEQTHRSDLRYDSFIASIIEKDDISPRIKILNWNYDYQFEKAFSTYLGVNTLSIIQEILSICPTPNKEKPLSPYDDLKKLKMVKLNGTTSFINNGNEVNNILDNIEIKLEDVPLKSIIDNYYQPNWRSLIKFAWEYYATNETYRLDKEIEFITKKTCALVIIGYSFPFFNRHIDKMIFEKLNTKKIYIQDKDPERIRDRLLGGIVKRSDEWKIVLINDIEQFLLPFEL